VGVGDSHRDSYVGSAIRVVYCLCTREEVAVSRRTQLTVTVSPELGRYVEEVSAELNLKRSAVVERALEADRERRELDLLRQGYEEMAEHGLALHKEFEHVDSETPSPAYAETE
jgi:predicted transcriptional regulator